MLFDAKNMLFVAKGPEGCAKARAAQSSGCVA
jgi:hypothetical protein